MLKKCLAVFCLIMFAPSLPLSVHAANLVPTASNASQIVIREINDAKEEIRAHALSFTSAPIVKALVDAHQRGVRIEAILDQSQPKDVCTSATFLANAKAAIYVDTIHPVADNRMMIIDRATVITASSNFTAKGEENNHDSLCIIRSKDRARHYVDIWSSHRQHSENYQRQRKQASRRTVALKKP